MSIPNKNEQLLLVPIKSSLSVILNSDEFWFNFNDKEISGKTTSNRSVRDPFIVTDTNVGKEWYDSRFSGNGKNGNSRNFSPVKFVQKSSKKWAQSNRMSLRYVRHPRRQVFTFPRLNWNWTANRCRAGKRVDVFESSGRDLSPKQVRSTNKTVDLSTDDFHRLQLIPFPHTLPDKMDAQEICSDEPTPSSDSVECPPLANSDSKCFTEFTKSQLDLFHVVSQRSFPDARWYSTAFTVEDVSRKEEIVAQIHKELCVLATNAFAPLYPTNNNYYEYLDECETSTISTMGNMEPQLTESRRQLKGTLSINYQRLNDILAENLASTITNLAPQYGKFMSYAKFNPKFKLSEDFYEDVTNLSFTSEPVGGFKTFHQLNPDFDENQSLTEAMTSSRSPSSSTCVTAKPEVIKVCHQLEKVQSAKISPNQMGQKSAVGKNFTGTGDVGASLVSRYDYLKPTNKMLSNPVASLSLLVSAVRKNRQKEFEAMLRNALNCNRKENDLRFGSDKRANQTVASSKSPFRTNESPANVISQPDIFTDVSHPIWWLKENTLHERLSHRRAKRLYNFVSTAHHYMCDKDYRRSTMTRCYFRARPVVRSVDEGVQCPEQEYTKSCDRSVEIKLSNAKSSAGFDTTLASALAGGGDFVELAPITTPNQVDEEDKSRSHLFQGCCNYESVQSRSETQAKTDHSTPSVGRGVLCAKLNSLAFLQKTNTSKMTPVSVQNVQLEKKQFNQEFRAVCDKKRIRIRYENGKYTVYKVVNRRRPTIWSTLTGKATHFFSSVVSKKADDEEVGPRNTTCH